MHDKTYQYMMSSQATGALKNELQDILKRDKEDRPQVLPTEQLQVASAELALRALSGDYGVHNVDPLLDTVGALYSRNKSLTKGHATLTRRVQELEAALAAEKQRTFAAWTEKGFASYDNKGVRRVQLGAIDPESAQLAEAKQQVPVTGFNVVGGKAHVNDAFIEKGAISKAKHDLHQFVTEEVKRQLVAATKSGGILNGR